LAQEPPSDAEWAAIKKAEADRIAAIQKAFGTVVAVFGADKSGGGSGVLIDPAGYALTNYHVVAAAGSQGQAGLADGKLYPWELIGVDPGGDVALIRLRRKEPFPIAELGDSAQVKVGDWAIAMGNPFLLAEDYHPTVTLGLVSGVERYQAGVGLNELVYGDCIQVDAAISPGNSGGPLFDFRSRLIGVNGRASFGERGRVNVGLGYAISINQIKRFLPDLLAAKTAQHGTLDAQFGMRSGRVVCHTINLDSPAAKRGLKLGDELLEFEGRKIKHANQLANLISALPAGWPVNLVVHRGEEQQSIDVRLLPLPYSTKPEEPAAEAPDPNKKTPPRAIPLREITSPEERNRAACRLLLARCKSTLGTAQFAKQYEGLRWTDDLWIDSNSVGSITTTVAIDGRFRVEIDQSDELTTYAFDGKTYWRQVNDQPAKEATPISVLKSPQLAHAILLADMFRSDVFRAGDLMLEGSDQSRGVCAYRFQASDRRGSRVLWLSTMEDGGPTATKPLKVAIDTAGAGPALVFKEWVAFKGLLAPQHSAVVEGLAETEQMEMIAKERFALREVDDAIFKSPLENE